MADVDVKKIVEAVLFAADSSIPLDRLAAIVEEAEKREIREALKALAEQYDSEERPYALAEVAGGWQMYCRPDYSKWIRELHKGRIATRLSQAALETLAIVAYKQPIVRAEIETIRGVDSSGVLATLMRRDLITIAGRAPGMGRALMYRTTKEFLRYFGLNFVTDLPRLEEFAEVLGLKPGELELAVEGAESVAEVTGGTVDDTEPAVDVTDGATEGTEPVADPTETGIEEPPPPDCEPSEGVPVLQEPDGIPSVEAPGGDDAATGPDNHRGFESHGNSHALDDRSLIDEIDED